MEPPFFSIGNIKRMRLSLSLVEVQAQETPLIFFWPIDWKILNYLTTLAFLNA